MNNRFQLTEGVFIYVLGLVMIATRPGRFWFGFALAMLPVFAGAFGKLLGGVCRQIR